MRNTLDKRKAMCYNIIGRDAEGKNGRAVKCGCGKLIAVQRDGRLYVKCRGCGAEVEIEYSEPRAE